MNLRSSTTSATDAVPLSACPRRTELGGGEMEVTRTCPSPWQARQVCRGALRPPPRPPRLLLLVLPPELRAHPDPEQHSQGLSYT
jgi:hypothetical protein